MKNKITVRIMNEPNAENLSKRMGEAVSGYYTAHPEELKKE